MSVDTTLDAGLTLVLAKARSGLGTTTGGGTSGGGTSTPPPVASRPATINFEFPGGGQPIVLANCDPCKVGVPFPSQIVWARLAAGDAAGQPVAVSATVDVQMTSFETFGASVPLSGSGTIPGLQLNSIRNCDLTGWHTNLVTGDWLIARLTTFSGFATWVALELLLQPTEIPIGVSSYVDAGGDVYVDANGNPYVFRS